MKIEFQKQQQEDSSSLKIESKAKKHSNNTFSNSAANFDAYSENVDPVRNLHQSIGNKAVQHLFQGGAIQAKLKIGAVNDKHEQQADQVADQVMRMSNHEMQANVLADRVMPVTQQDQANLKPDQTQAANDLSQAINLPESPINQLGSGGRPLSKNERNFFEPRFKTDFSQVRLHDDNNAAKAAKSINARAFALGNKVVFAKNMYSSSSQSGRRLLAHELTHVVQQNRRSEKNRIQRTIELRPPGRGEATAFDRANELVDRLNRLSLAVSYSLAADGRTLAYQIVLPSRINNFDQQMVDFIDLPQVLPMRLITSAGSVGGFPIVGDSFLHGYVDLDDLMASDDIAFQSIMVHFLEERAVTNRYAQRIGTPGLDANTPAGERAFRRGHNAGHVAQAENFRDIFNDPSIIFNRERRRNNAGDADIIFRSATHNYRILITLRRAVPSSTGARPRNLTGGTVTVRYLGNTYTVEDFLNNGPLAAVLNPPSIGAFNLTPPFSSTIPGIGFGLDPLNLGPGLRMPGLGASPSPSLLGPTPLLTNPPGPSTLFSPNLSTPFLHRPNPLVNLSFPLLSPNPNLIDWLPIRGELNTRGVPFNDQMQSSIVTLWANNYSFLNRVGFSQDQSVFWTNKTISMAVGSGVNRDYPSLLEQMDRQLGTSSLIFPVSDIFRFLIGR